MDLRAEHRYLYVQTLDRITYFTNKTVLHLHLIFNNLQSTLQCPHTKLLLGKKSRSKRDSRSLPLKYHVQHEGKLYFIGEEISVKSLFLKLSFCFVSHEIKWNLLPQGR